VAVAHPAADAVAAGAQPRAERHDRKVLIYSIGAHLVGFAMVLAAHYVNVYSRPVRDDGSYMHTSSSDADH
jgi:hypothetical protein